jgi:hypothetical protein
VKHVEIEIVFVLRWLILNDEDFWGDTCGRSRMMVVDGDAIERMIG